MGERSWDLDAGGSGQSADFTKFPVGTTRIRIIESQPYIRWTHWMPQFNRSVNCPGMKICPIDEIIEREKANGVKNTTYSRARRYSMNIYNYETDRVEIMEQGKTFFEDLKMLAQDAKEEGQSLSDWVIKVRRTGTGKDDTNYRLDKKEDTNEPIPTEGIVDLEEFFKPHTPEQITKLLSVTENFKDAWKEIMTEESKEEAKEDKGEDIEIE